MIYFSKSLTKAALEGKIRCKLLSHCQMRQTGLLENRAKSFKKSAPESKVKYVVSYISHRQMRRTGLLENTAKSLRKTALEGKIR